MLLIHRYSLHHQRWYLYNLWGFAGIWEMRRMSHCKAPTGTIQRWMLTCCDVCDASCCARYLEHTGLMWENAAEFGALLVFAEHRYYGEHVGFPSLPRLGVTSCGASCSLKRLPKAILRVQKHAGVSKPYRKGMNHHLQYLTSEQVGTGQCVTAEGVQLLQ